MQSEYFKKNKLPDKSGIYLFKKNKHILYVGKATSLRDRVKSYMSKRLFDMRGPLIEKMIEEANKIDWQVTDSVLEALILEANLIKKFQPKYNTKEKSDKSFNYVCITKSNLRHGVDGLPRVIVMRGSQIKNKILAHVFGPFPNSSQLREAMKIIRKIFPFLDDKSKNYIEFYRQINLAPDLNDRKLYMQNIKNIILFFEGKKKKVLKNLEKEMKEYAKEREFEKAGEIKRQMFALKHINDVAMIKENFPPLLVEEGAGGGDSKERWNSTFRIEAYDIAHMGGKNMVGVMAVFENGEAAKNEYRKFKIKTQNDANDTGALKEVLERRLAHREWQMPNLIVVDGGKAQINSVKRVLTRLNLVIPVVSVLKDEYHKPKNILGDPSTSLRTSKQLALKFEREILFANSEAHRFAIAYHKNMRNRNFLTQ